MSRKSSHRASRDESPAPIEHEVLGLIRFRCHLNPTCDEYEGTTEIDGAEVELNLYSDEDLNITGTVTRTQELVRDHGAMSKRIAKYVADNVMPQYMNGWHQSGTRKPTRKEFMSQLTMMVLTVHADGKATYWFDPGELFGGHILQLFMDSKSVITDHDTPG